MRFVGRTRSRATCLLAALVRWRHLVWFDAPNPPANALETRRSLLVCALIGGGADLPRPRMSSAAHPSIVQTLKFARTIGVSGGDDEL